MDNSMPDALPAMAMLGGFIFAFIIMLIPQIFYLLTLQKCLTKVKEKNRTMTPAYVWFNLIPLFSLGWQFYVVKKIQTSLINEYKERNLSSDGSFGYKIGIAMCIASCCGIIPFIGFFAGIAGIILWIIYWIKIAEFSKELDNPVNITASENIDNVQTANMQDIPDMPKLPDTPENPKS